MEAVDELLRGTGLVLRSRSTRPCRFRSDRSSSGTRGRRRGTCRTVTQVVRLDEGTPVAGESRRAARKLTQVDFELVGSSNAIASAGATWPVRSPISRQTSLAGQARRPLEHWPHSLSPHRQQRCRREVTDVVAWSGVMDASSWTGGVADRHHLADPRAPRPHDGDRLPVMLMTRSPASSLLDVSGTYASAMSSGAGGDARSDPDLDGVGAGVDERLGRLGRRDVADDDLDLVAVAVLQLCAPC